MSTQLNITNSALSRLGANTIISLDEGTAEQQVAVAAWDLARRATLRDHPWNFAITDATLNQVADFTPYEFKYAYRLPALCVRLLQVYGNPTYRVQGGNVLTDQETCRIKFVQDVQDPTQWDALFDDLMAQRLASDMAYALTKSQATADSMFALYDRKLKKARHVDSTEDVMDPIGGFASPFLAARY